jgi:[NiFe] hydrogenase diaphorase moiety large subunit
MSAQTQGKITFDSIDALAGLKKALGMQRSDVIAELSSSRLKGRGGAGFPVATKWNLAAAAVSDERFVVCNADEGEPGTFKDRVILSDFADLVFAGMTIGAKVIGSKKGIVYLRGEYAYLRRDLEAKLEERRKAKLLGKGILGSDLEFDIEIRMGSGAYVCGEETALIESLEGNRGEPRNRPPFPVDTGYFGKPTIVNNVETFACVAAILGKGAAWFAGMGTEKSSGFKLLSVSGDCARPGVYEVALGITISDLLKLVGGEDAKAVQVGGASGVCVPRAEFGRKVAFEDVSTGGSVIVFGPARDMLHVAHNFMEFFEEESCGQCTPCREGNQRIREGVESLLEGKCSAEYLGELERLGEVMQLASKCGLGQSSANAFLSIVKHFRGEIMGRERAYAAAAKE